MLGAEYRSQVLRGVAHESAKLLNAIRTHAETIVRFPRKAFTFWTFVIMTVMLALLGLLAEASPWLMLIPFVVYSFVMSAASNITQVYPPELFPTHLRGERRRPAQRDQPHRLGDRDIPVADQPGEVGSVRVDVLARRGARTRRAGHLAVGAEDGGQEARLIDGRLAVRPERLELPTTSV